MSIENTGNAQGTPQGTTPATAPETTTGSETPSPKEVVAEPSKSNVEKVDVDKGFDEIKALIKGNDDVFPDESIMDDDEEDTPDEGENEPEPEGEPDGEAEPEAESEGEPEEDPFEALQKKAEELGYQVTPREQKSEKLALHPQKFLNTYQEIIERERQQMVELIRDDLVLDEDATQEERRMVAEKLQKIDALAEKRADEFALAQIQTAIQSHPLKNDIEAIRYRMATEYNLEVPYSIAEALALIMSDAKKQAGKQTGKAVKEAEKKTRETTLTEAKKKKGAFVEPGGKKSPAKAGLHPVESHFMKKFGITEDKYRKYNP